MRKFQRFILTMLLWGVPMGPALAQTPAPAFESSTARIAGWNLAGIPAIPDARLEEQVKALQLLDAEVVALVEVNPVSVLDRLQAKLAEAGLAYEDPVIIDKPGVQQDIGARYRCDQSSMAGWIGFRTYRQSEGSSGRYEGRKV
jgi:hypothetical protein